jgi:large subunit ribosomal protein L53
MLRHLKKVFIQFAPGDPRAVSARELLQRVTGDKAKKSNPACVVTFEIDEQGKPGQAYAGGFAGWFGSARVYGVCVHITVYRWLVYACVCADLLFSDNEHRKLFTADHNVEAIAKMIDDKGSEMEMRGIMREVRAWRACLRVLYVWSLHLGYVCEWAA